MKPMTGYGVALPQKAINESNTGCRRHPFLGKHSKVPVNPRRTEQGLDEKSDTDLGSQETTPHTRSDSVWARLLEEPDAIEAPKGVRRHLFEVCEIDKESQQAESRPVIIQSITSARPASSSSTSSAHPASSPARSTPAKKKKEPDSSRYSTHSQQ